MAKNSYIIKYTDVFTSQFNSVLKYFIYELNNKIVAEKFFNEVITKIEKRSENPESLKNINLIRKEKIHIIEYM